MQSIFFSFSLENYQYPPQKHLKKTEHLKRKEHLKKASHEIVATIKTSKNHTLETKNKQKIKPFVEYAEFSRENFNIPRDEIRKRNPSQQPNKMLRITLPAAYLV